MMRGLPEGQYIAGNSLLHRLDAVSKLICLLLFMTAVVGTSTVPGYLLLLAAVAAFIRMAEATFQSAFGGVLRLWRFIIIIFLMNMLFYGSGTPLVSWWIFHPSMEGIRQGLHVIANVVLLMVSGNLLLMTTTVSDITRAIERLIRPLKLLGVPTAEAAMIMSIALQFIPTLLEETEHIKMAQTARGARFDSRRLTERAADMIPLVVPIFIAAFRRADELSLAMEARGYRGEKYRTRAGREPLALRDYSAVMLCIGICTLQLFLF